MSGSHLEEMMRELSHVFPNLREIGATSFELLSRSTMLSALANRNCPNLVRLAMSGRGARQSLGGYLHRGATHLTDLFLGSCHSHGFGGADNNDPFSDPAT